MIPNLLAEVERCKRDYPQAWAQAHTGSSQTKDFIRLLAARCHRIDPRFGLNGKRGNPNDISDDVLNYKGEGPGHDPTNNGMAVTVIDVIGAAGSPAAYPTWQVFDQLPGPGAWVAPNAAPTPPPAPTPAPSLPALGEDAQRPAIRPQGGRGDVEREQPIRRRRHAGHIMITLFIGEESSVLDKIENLQKIDPQQLQEFKRLMTDEVIPEIIKVVEERRVRAAESRLWQLKC